MAEKQKNELFNKKYRDVVYHFSSSDLINLDRPLELKSFPGRGKEAEWRQLEEFLDNQRPEHIKKLGISRKGAVFGNPTIKPFNNSIMWGAWPERGNRDTARRVAIGIHVDPDKVVVCDARLLNSGIVKHAGLSEENERLAKEMADKYWASAISLSDFRELYQVEDGLGGRLAIQKAIRTNDEASPDHLRRYEEPEVLIPGPIAVDQLYLAAMGIHHQMYMFEVYGPTDEKVAA